MKKIFIFLLVTSIALSTFAQSPQKMSYQAVIRNSSNQLVTNHVVGMRISILQNSTTGTPVYIETQTPTTNSNGLASIEIGGGNIITGTFAGIDWSAGMYFIKTETDPTGGTNYSITGISQWLSVPYALYASKSGLIKDGKPFEFYIKDDLTLIVLPKISVEKPYSVVPSVTDADGNTYATVKIGTQIWLAENLKTTKYNDNTPIPLVTNDFAWTALTTPAYGWYNNDIANKTIYGALYNWYAVNTNKLCPTGWHVPSIAEFIVLDAYLGSFAGGRLRESGTTHWHEPNTDAINDSKFTALPSYQNGDYASWWSSSEYDHPGSSEVNYFYLVSFETDTEIDKSSKSRRCSVRCLMD